MKLQMNTDRHGSEFSVYLWSILCTKNVILVSSCFCGGGDDSAQGRREVLSNGSDSDLRSPPHHDGGARRRVCHNYGTVRCRQVHSLEYLWNAGQCLEWGILLFRTCGAQDESEGPGGA